MSKKMIIELRGVEFINKGAELMLYAILSKFEKELPQAKFAMELSPRVPKDKLNELGILEKVKGGKRKLMLSVLPKVIRNSSNVALEKDVDIVLDGSGFAFGDKWGAHKAGIRLANHISKWKDEGKKVFVLPQAFGPFTDNALREKMQIILEKADLVIARDPVSLSYISSLKPNADNIRIAPDFTNLVSAEKVEEYKHLQGQVAIIPNFKMLEGKDDNERQLYFRFLERSIFLIQREGYKAFFLLHEGNSDEEIAKVINESLPDKLSIIKEPHPLKVKGIIGNSRGIISSRFHGLVSSLCQGVPCIATGWSHKYEMLLKDYDFSEGLVEVNIDDDSLSEKLGVITDPEKHYKISAQLEKCALILKNKSNVMWGEVIEHIKNG